MEKERKTNTSSRRSASLSVPELLHRQLILTRALLITVAVAFLLLLITVLAIVPKAVRTLNAADQFLQNADSLITQLDGVDQAVDSLTAVAIELEKANLPEMIEEIGNLVGSSQETIEETRKKIDEMDMESLNQAISDLSAVVSPLAKLFGGK